MIDGRVARDPEEPGRELVGGVEAVERLEDLQKDLLGQIQRVVAASDHPGDVRNDPDLVSAHQSLEELLLAAENPADELSVLELRVGWPPLSALLRPARPGAARRPVLESPRILV